MNNRQISSKLRIYYGVSIAVVILTGVISIAVHVSEHDRVAIGSASLASKQTPGLIAANDTHTTPHTVGWSTYCSDYQKLCFKYPKQWTIQTQAGTSNSSYPAVEVNDSNANAAVVFQPIAQTEQQDCAQGCSFTLLSRQQVANLPSLQVITGVSYNGSRFIPIAGDMDSSQLTKLRFVENHAVKITTNVFSPLVSSTTNPSEETSLQVQEPSPMSYPSEVAAAEWFKTPGFLTAETVEQSLFSAQN